MQQTNFNYIVSAPPEDESQNDDVISSPDTGTYTTTSTDSGLNNDNTNYFINSATIISLALILLSLVFFIVKKKGNKTKAFNDGVIDLKYKNKNNIISSIFATILLLSGLITLITNIANYTTATPAPNDDFTTKKDVTTTVTLDKTGSVTACATDTITMTNDLVGGYTLDFTASNINPAISSITEYELTIDDETTPTTITPNETITIKDITTATSAGDTTDVTLCISFPADIEPGTYTVTGAYDSTVEIYSVVWKNYDGTVLYEDNSVSRGTTPEYGGTIPVKPADAQYSYTFNGWTPEVAVATEDTIYTATYTQQAINYTITYDLADGTLPTGSTNPTTYNVETNTFTLINPERTNYAFTGWTGSNGTAPQTTVTIAKGTTGNLNYVANWEDCPVNYICYNDNGANSPTTMSNQGVSSTATSVTLWASNFQYTGGGYGFAGWNTKANGTGTSYGPNEDITDETVINKIKSEGLDLYAMWIPSAGNLQNWNGCNNMNIGDVTALTDTRDNNTYAVAKLADGNCWMIENLRLGGEEAITLTSDNSNLTSGSSFTLSATQDPTTNAWCIKWDSADCVNQSMLASNNTTNTISNMTSPELDNSESKGIYSMGNYYNWYSATAGTGTYSTTSGSATGSICPAGWHLPTGNTNGEFSALDKAMGGTGGYQSTAEASRRWRTYPANYIYSGNAYGSLLSGRGSYGNVWSSTAYSLGDRAYELDFGSGYVYPGMNNGKCAGYSVRCAF